MSTAVTALLNENEPEYGEERTEMLEEEEQYPEPAADTMLAGQ